MSLDLYERDISERMSGLRPITAPEPGAFDNFLYSAGTAAMRTFASAGRAVTMAAGGVASAVERIGAMHPLSDGAVDTRLSDAVWRVHDDLTQRAVDYWTPNPNEVGAAGQVVGQLIATLPMVVASPSALVAATQLGTAEDVMRKGVDADKAQAVGAVQAAGLGLGIWMPILGQNLWQRVVLGGAGFNVVQGAATRGISGEILEGTPAAEEFKAFDPAALTLDVLLGAAFGGIAHLSPSQRAQGKAMLDRIQSWGKDLKPSDVDALQVVRQAQHMNVDSMPGKPVDVQDIEAHVQRVKAAIDQLSGDRPVQVDDLPAARVGADQARTAEQQANLSVLQELGERVRRLERIPMTPDEIAARAESIGTRIADQVQAAGRSADEAQAVGKVWESFFATAAKRYGVDPQQLFDTYRVEVRTGDAGATDADAIAPLDPNNPNILEQSAVENLQMVAKRGERVTSSRGMISQPEKEAIASSAKAVGVSEDEVARAVRSHKMAHPVSQGWAPLIYNRTVVDDGKVVHEYKNVPYTFSTSRNGRPLESGTPEYDRRSTAIARSMADEVRTVLRRAQAGDKNAQNILAQAGWYKAMRSRLRQEFGGLGDLFADLLGATSPNTPVRDNWTNAVDALRRASRGDFDALIPQWEKWADNVDAKEAELRGFVNERLEEGMTKAAIKATPEYKAMLSELKEVRKLPDSLLPTKETGKKYGFNGRNVARAMVDLWRVVKNADPDINRGGTAPKALNFSGNLIGFRERATIDVWAARMLQRLSGGDRIPSMAETGVTGDMLQSGDTTLQFGFGQDVFSKAVDLIKNDPEMSKHDALSKINDDDLQAVVWFVEKELWTVNNWTNAAGEGGSFELEANLTGPADQARIKALRKILDSSKSTDAAKEAARSQLVAMERTVDRFTGGLSIQRSLGTQGVDYVPTDADMAKLSNRVRTAAYEVDNGSTVLASKALSTEGRYGGIERSLDIEVVAREGYDAAALWREMLTQARDADQDSVFLSRVLREGEAIDYSRHRPGVEIYFREAAAKEKLEAMVKSLGDKGVEFFTVIVDGRRMSAASAGEMPPAVGVRFQYVPEFEQRYGMDNLKGLSDAELQARMEVKGEQLSDLAQQVTSQIDGVSFAGRFWYDTEVAFRHEYQGKIDALTTRNSSEGSATARAEVWAGRPIREGLENADRAANEAARGEPNVGARADFGVDAQARPDGVATRLEQAGAAVPRGAIQFDRANTLISVFKNADESTLIHESGHFFLQVTKDLASRADAPEGALRDWSTLASWLKNEGGELTRAQQEQFARGFEAYLGSGEAPTPALKSVFERFKDWLLNIYKSLTSLDVKLSDDVRAVMGRMLSDETEARPAPRPAEPPRSMAEEQGGAEVRAEGEQAPDPLAYAAERIANERPDLAFTIGRDADGNPVTTTVRQYLDDVRADVAAAMDDARLFEAAAVCLLGKG